MIHILGKKVTITIIGNHFYVLNLKETLIPRHRKLASPLQKFSIINRTFRIFAVAGKPETTGDVLKSIMAIFVFRKSIDDLKVHPTDPANFSTHLYQPEKDVNGEQIHHREDHNHLLKRIVSRLRGGHIPDVNLLHFRDALHDPSTGLTYEALTGKNKQSVPDCERLISPGVIAFMEQNGHVKDALVIKLLHNWHKAVDGRGLSENERSMYCNKMKEWLLDDWMPWHRYEHDFGTIDVNRYCTLLNYLSKCIPQYGLLITHANVIFIGIKQ